MKSTYKLIGDFWDWKDVPDEVPEIIDLDEGLPSIDAVPNLFDNGYPRRMLPASMLLSAPNESALSELVASIRWVSSLVIVPDRLPLASGTVPRRFYLTKLLQASAAIKKAHPSMKVALGGRRPS